MNEKRKINFAYTISDRLDNPVFRETLEADEANLQESLNEFYARRNPGWLYDFIRQYLLDAEEARTFLDIDFRERRCNSKSFYEVWLLFGTGEISRVLIGFIEQEFRRDD